MRQSIESRNHINQDRQIVRNTVCLTLWSFFCASFIWFLIASAASVVWFPRHFVMVAVGPPILAWAGLAAFGLTQRHHSAQAAGVAGAALILPFLCGGSWALLLTLILTHD
jgi:hypothetical protein